MDGSYHSGILILTRGSFYVHANRKVAAVPINNLINDALAYKYHQYVSIRVLYSTYERYVGMKGVPP